MDAACCEKGLQDRGGKMRAFRCDAGSETVHAVCCGSKHDGRVLAWHAVCMKNCVYGKSKTIPRFRSAERGMHLYIKWRDFSQGFPTGRKSPVGTRWKIPRMPLARKVFFLKKFAFRTAREALFALLYPIRTRRWLKIRFFVEKVKKYVKNLWGGGNFFNKFAA